MEFQKIVNFLEIASDNKDLPKLYQRFTKIYHNLLLKNGLKFMIYQKEITMSIKKLELKHQC